MRAVAESLAGRAKLIELEGLSWHEVHAARPGWTAEQGILRGGLPELAADPTIDARGFFRSYLTTYLERDLRQALRVQSLLSFERFLRACALRTGQLLNRADLARDVGISAPTAAEWLDVLVSANQVVLLEPRFSNRTKSLVKPPKLCLADSGLAAYLSGVDTPADLHGPSPLGGALWETYVFGELRRRQIARTGGWTLAFWRDRTQEVDFLLHRAGHFTLADAELTELTICRAPNPYPVHAFCRAPSIGDVGELAT